MTTYISREPGSECDSPKGAFIDSRTTDTNISTAPHITTTTIDPPASSITNTDLPTNLHTQSIHISIEGNIGSGKSTLLKLLSRELNLTVADEPVKDWVTLKDSEQKNILHRYYEDPPKYAALFQAYACATRLKTFSSLTKRTNSLISERCMFTDKHVFAKNAYESKYMTELEFKIYEQIFDIIAGHATLPDVIIYLRCSPEICMERIKKRARIEEEKIELGYLRDLHKCHEEWLIKRNEACESMECNKETCKCGNRKEKGPKVIIIDASQDIQSIKSQVISGLNLLGQ